MGPNKNTYVTTWGRKRELCDVTGLNKGNCKDMGLNRGTLCDYIGLKKGHTVIWD
jgi:hypothetical protein